MRWLSILGFGVTFLETVRLIAKIHVIFDSQRKGEWLMDQAQWRRRGETTVPPTGYEVIRTRRRYFPVRLHLEDREYAGASAFYRPDGSVVSFARRLPAVSFLYQHIMHAGNVEGKLAHVAQP